MRARIGLPVHINVGWKQIKLERLAELLNICEEKDILMLEASLQQVIYTYAEWVKAYKSAQKERGF